MFVALLIILTLFSGIEVHADIYRYLNDEGVECFTDTPATSNAKLVIRDRQKKRMPAARPTGPQHLAATGSANINGTPDVPPSGMGSETARNLPVHGKVTSLTGLRLDPFDGKLRHHNGVDIAVPEGTSVRPVAPGVVLFSGYRSGYGNTVIVKHSDGMLTVYGHNSVNLKAEGDPVDRDSAIAFSGSTGRSTGPHLHFEAWKNGDNITTSFVPAGEAPRRLQRENDAIRKIVQADGTLFFSNLP